DSQALYDNLMAFSLIDIRGAEDFAKGHIEGAKNIPMAKIGEAIPSFSTNRKIAITCYSGQTAGQTVGVLRALGFDAYSLKGGMNNGYLTTDLPVVQ
ncbi:MAG: rhodanese-like domain-containing protein, partial [Sphaerochaetaceae bacterium]|nr:rhodanese-like domain-containing protein [Sphaerochaetaceae bacterium]